MAKMNKPDGPPVQQDQKINTSGRGRSLSVGKVLPHTWEWVRVTVTEETKTSVTLHIKKLEIREAR